MGRHVDHRGGYANVMAIDKETLFAAAPRADDKVTLANADNSAFSKREFAITEPLGSNIEDKWGNFVDSPGVTRSLQNAPGDWSHYARAALLRLQHEQHEQRLNGMDCIVLGNVPGRYGCSTQAIDRIVDRSSLTEGVIGAQITGAGLGGCAVVLVRSEHRE